MTFAANASHHPQTPAERRVRNERRARPFWSLAYGSFKPRRRSVRRGDEYRVQMVDWHHPHLLGAALGVVLLCTVDAFLTLTLLAHGASELNPVMEGLLYHSIAVFAVVKMALTGVGVLTLVALSRCRLFGKVRVDIGLYAALAAYIALVAYEFSLLKLAA